MYFRSGNIDKCETAVHDSSYRSGEQRWSVHSELHWPVDRRSEVAQLRTLRHTLIFHRVIGINILLLFRVFSLIISCTGEITILSDMSKCSFVCCYVRNVTRSWWLNGFISCAYWWLLGNKISSINTCEFVGILICFMDLINERNVEHGEMNAV